MIPARGERPDDWFAKTGWEEAVADHAKRDEGRAGTSHPLDAFYHDVPDALAEQSRSRERHQSPAPGRRPWALDAWPDVPPASCCATRIGSSRLRSCDVW